MIAAPIQPLQPLTQSWTQLRFHPEQNRLWRTRSRFAIVAAGRGSGKTELARRRVVRFLPVTKPWPDPMYFYALPTFSQARRVAWKPIKRLIPREWVKRISESELSIETVWGSTLYVLGMDKPYRAEGVQWDGGIIDESSDQKPGIFDLTFMPAFSHRRAWCWRIGVPKRFGIGSREFKKAFERGQRGEGDCDSFTWPSRDILGNEALRVAAENMDAVDFSEQFEASWERAGGSIFHAFDAVQNVSAGATYHPELPILVGSDFNVDPMCWVLGHAQQDGRLEIFDEVFLRNTNTQNTLDHLSRRYETHRSGWQFYGDSTGRARKTAASESDYAQIKNFEGLNPKAVYYPKSNPSILNRFAACNAMFRNAVGVRRCTINPRCKRLIADLENRSWREGVREPNDYGDLGHMSDAFGYLIHRRYPMMIEQYGEAPNVFAG